MAHRRIEAADQHVGNQHMAGSRNTWCIGSYRQLQAAVGSYRQLLGSCPNTSGAHREQLETIFTIGYIGALDGAR